MTDPDNIVRIAWCFFGARGLVVAMENIPGLPRLTVWRPELVAGCYELVYDGLLYLRVTPGQAGCLCSMYPPPSVRN